MAPASVGETTPEVMVPMMMKGISSAGQLPLKVRQSSFHSKWPCSGWTFSFLAKM